MSKRITWLKLRISHEELTMLRELARAEGVNVSDFVRKRIGLSTNGRVKKSVSRA